jgi:hypothetical protein
LKQNGTCLPVSLSEIIPILTENPAQVIRELSQNEHLANSALYEGPLLLGAAMRLENLGGIVRSFVKGSKRGT